MATLEIEGVPRADWVRAAESLPEYNLMQSWEYGDAKQATGPWRPERCLVRNKTGTILAGVQVLVRTLPMPIRGGLAWINRGPLCGPADLPAVLAAVRRRYAHERGFYTRVALPISPGIIPSSALRDAGFAVTDTTGWASTRVDLTRSLEEIRAHLDQKWRNALSKAEKGGLSMSEGAEMALFDVFLAQYEAFLAARGFETTVRAPLLTALNNAFPPNRRMTCFLIHKDEVAIAGALIVRVGAMAEYLVGFTHDIARGTNAGQLLLWRALTHARETGCISFDLGGADPALTPPGILHFKTGMGGIAYRYENEIESTGGGVLSRLVRWRANAARQSA